LHRALPSLLFAAALLAPASPRAAEEQPSILLTIFLRHDQSHSLDALQAIQKRNRFLERFPPQGVEVVSWYVMMGIGQVVTLRLPPARLRDVNLAIEQGAWGAFRTEVYATYDYKPILEEEKRKQTGGK
jgi:hypothetical protein